MTGTIRTQPSSSPSRSLASKSSLAISASPKSSSQESGPLLTPEERQHILSPPRTVVVQPSPVPYAQLCFNATENRLVTMMVGTYRPTKYVPLPETAFHLPVAASQSLSFEDIDDNISWSTTPSMKSSFSRSTEDSESTTWYDASPQEIVWIDQEWYYSDHADIMNIGLLHDVLSSDEYDADVETIGCGKILKVAICKAKSSSREKGPSKPFSPKRLLSTKECGYSLLK